MVIEFKEKLFRNALLPTVSTLFKSTVFKEVQPENVLSSIFLTPSGILISSKEVQPKNASDSIVSTFRKSIFFNEVHLLKALLFIVVTLLERVTEDNELQEENVPSLISVTSFGIVISVKEEHSENA